jgi:hypothetical protein
MSGDNSVYSIAEVKYVSWTEETVVAVMWGKYLYSVGAVHVLNSAVTHSLKAPGFIQPLRL